MYNIMNCTPHTVTILSSLLDGSTLAYVQSLLTKVERRRITAASGRQDGLVIPPSVYRLAALAHTTGPDLGCDVSYELSPEAVAECHQLSLDFSTCIGVDMIVIASEISVIMPGRRFLTSGIAICRNGKPP